ncbi:hypothetical protein [Streptomyces sp. NPDC048737]|uniref:hypothetical protein n=1 Tax=unclassified Streptomyces TaxID=2593676 RepID=UPI00342EAEF2
MAIESAQSITDLRDRADATTRAKEFLMDAWDEAVLAGASPGEPVRADVPDGCAAAPPAG